MLGRKDVERKDVGEGFLGLLRKSGDFVEDGIVCDAKIAAEDVDQDALWWHLARREALARKERLSSGPMGR